MNILDGAIRLARKYMNDNPPEPLVMRPFYDGGIRRGADYRYRADMNELFPEAKIGDAAEVQCVYIAAEDEIIGMTITLLGAASLSVNGKTVFKSDVFTERNNHIDNKINISMKKGENILELRFCKTKLGFGAIFGTWLAKWDYLLWRPDVKGVEGCRYRLNGGEWLPKLKTAELGLSEGEYALFYTKTKSGEKLFVRGASFPDDGDCVNPFGIEGFGAWVGLYPLRGAAEPDFMRPTENTYWRFKYENVWLRPYNGEGCFGRWNYPLGVTLYGLTRLGLLLKDGEICDYVLAHVSRCTQTYEYALWDKARHGGAASLHNLLCSIDSLDDCGSFGSLLEEAFLSLGAENTEEICGYVSDYIENRQPRLGSGAFCRRNQLHSFHNETVWLDDLYMSVPFLCRRYKITGDGKYIDDAARQFIEYRRLLQMPSGLMSHVFDLRRNMQTGVAWGRGNGWTLFALSEWLLLAPKEHPKREELEAFFVQLCRAYAPLQSEDGRWRQVLDEEDAYLETSCTAMFACAFARGARMKLLGAEYTQRAKNAVEAIFKSCVDGEGNLYGVCRGSEFSFSSGYYKYELTTRINDTHGIGIVLLAAVEVLT